MKRVLVSVALLIVSTVLNAQVTWQDYERASTLRDKYAGLILHEAGTPHFVGATSEFWYRVTVDGGAEFVLADAKTAVKKPAFDHAKLAVALSDETNKYTAIKLPFTAFDYTNDDKRAITFNIRDSSWRCDLTDYSCKKTGPYTPPPVPPRGASLRLAMPTDINGDELPSEENPYADDDLYPQQGRGGRGGLNPIADQTKRDSPDGKWEAIIRNHNVFIRPTSRTDATALSFDGSENNYYTLQSIAWSPDSKHLAAYRVRPATKHQVHYVESSPTDQVQPKHFVRDDPKPGDAVDILQPVLFDIASRKQTMVDNKLFPNAYRLTQLQWWKNNRAFTFEYNERGHQTYRVIEVNGETGAARALVDETSKTFITYSNLSLTASASETGGHYRHDVNDGAEIIWLSERDGWQHLYLFDGGSGNVKNQITKGEFVVRYIDKIDDAKRQIWFRACGMYPGKDPYLNFAYRINFDGTGLVKLTDGDGNHTPVYSTDMKYLVDTWSRVDAPPVTEVRDAENGKLIGELEHADVAKLTAAGWHAPEVFTAPGRDGKTAIWGVIYRPSSLDPKKKYPIIEDIYAGPQGAFVPKSFVRAPRPGTTDTSTSVNLEVLAELGFIVVKMDGMGTANRSRAFHDVAFKNIGDAGFPDRIAWIKAAAAKYPYMDGTRVGLFGTSAGGQNTLGGLLFHPEFYKVGVANSGCHDNRMDKMWWNEQWMGWPIGPEYAASSNVDNAHKLRGKLQLVVPELDTNVDPSSTMQVVNALIKANRKFDLLVVPGGDHGAGGRFGQRLMFDFFVHNLLGQEPPEWHTTDGEEPGTERVPN